MSYSRRWMCALLAAVLVTGASGCPKPRRPYPEVDRSVIRLIARLNSHRESAGLQPVLPDTGRCEVLGRVLPRFVADAEADFFGAGGLELLDHYVSDWNKHCFIVTARSKRRLTARLEESAGFLEALLIPDKTHMAVAFGESPAGGVWCAVCVTERLVHIVATAGSMSPGHGHVSFHGRTRYKDVMVEYYEKPTASGDQDTTVYRVPAEMRESGGFRVDLPFGYPDSPRKGTLEIVMYARNHEGEEYRPTNKTRFVVPTSKGFGR